MRLTREQRQALHEDLKIDQAILSRLTGCTQAILEQDQLDADAALERRPVLHEEGHHDR